MSLSCKEAWLKMSEVTSDGSIVRNFHASINMSDYLVETPLFQKDCLEAYSAWNLEKIIKPEQKKYFSELRGGSQGDYRMGMSKKIHNVVDAINRFPKSKRAVITIPGTSFPDNRNDDDAKCMREIHFYIENNRLNATVLFRAQAALIFPKNIHFIGSLMDEVRSGLDEQVELGTLFYLSSVLVADRQ